MPDGDDDVKGQRPRVVIVGLAVAKESSKNNMNNQALRRVRCGLIL